MTKKAKIFRFAGYQINTISQEIVFKYKVEFHNSEAISFSEKIILPKKTRALKNKDIHKFLEPLSLILGISYYKLYFPPKIETSIKLSKEQAEFWDTVYRKGLGEFLYRNKLDTRKIAKFPFSKITSTPTRVHVSDSILLGIGGGKDSTVAMNLLENFKTSLFSLETIRPDLISRSIIKKSGKPSITIKRIFDKKILYLKDAYEGHIPISAIYAFMGIFSCALYGHKYIVVANARTSNFGNVEYKGEIINHQWSKSAEFESLLQEYTRKFITTDIVYFSLLRQFYEIKVAKMFTKCREYFRLFTSCNKNFKSFGKRQKNLWCGECPKCAFVFLVLSPFINKSELVGIFGKDLLNDDSLIPLYRDLLGFGKMKPFDCVGTFEESRVALYLLSKKSNKDKVVNTFISKIKIKKETVNKVFKTYNANTLPVPFKFLGLDKVGIVGYGLEGKVTEKYIKKNYPNLKIKILDQKLDKNYLKKQEECDLVVKTPGIPMSKMKVPYTTASNLFFSLNKNLTIGITGSKGKSTTSSLVYEILKKAGKRVRLLGNIGRPMLEVLLKPIQKDEIFAIELSSYMLEDIEYSPNIAVLLNLFPEHMDYHGGIENYYKAKNNIFKYQKPGDVALRGPFTVKLPIKNSETQLLGRHNLENIKAAVKIARVLKISDKKIKEALLEFKGLSHRLEYVGEFKGIKFYDDAISTAPESTIEAIKSLPKTETIFLGGEDRGFNFFKLEKVLRKSNIKNIVLFPDTGQRILKSRKGFKILETKSMKEAVKFAFKNTEKGMICLLSTASPSYSVWKNFEEKGNLFKKFVKNYGE